jgi:chemotaxis protein methyltransferase WspC
MLQSSIERLIHQETGIDPTIIGSNLIRSAINRCMKMQPIQDLTEYWHCLQTNPQVLQQLIETVIVPETWFFRDRQPFELITRQFYQLRTAAEIPANQPLRILSLPCSTGEEPYSIAMALLQANIAPSAFQIDALDISRHNIQQAITGIYGKFSFRDTTNTSIQQQFFHAIGQSYQIHDRVKQCVHFQVGNALQLSIAPATYDVIFCRNLLIYFDQVTRQGVIDRLQQLLKSSGLLFVGHAETSLLMNEHWQSIRVPFTFAYRKTHSSSTKTKPTVTLRNPPHCPGRKFAPSTAKSYLNKAADSAPVPPDSVPPDPVPPDPVLAPPSLATTDLATTDLATTDLALALATTDLALALARQAADRGDFSSAKQLCAETLQQSPLQPALYVLLGQIHQAQDQLSMAETCFSKALYLDAHDLDALIHLARLKQSRGEQAAADRLYQRITRIQSQHPSEQHSEPQK